ncbi:alpha beta-hydrolase [Micractinium conductrix]|uniref:Alpha beta-hydrolase n=1 Tax=Micractinium conductrix TaxID=554055 RepID=A0A2P6VDK3_9CHLO|nr:alpha beta-hydrolase [Micractinium conductrix]|eukprot:PSC72141.1 alpha beta-hydrolase [Micractinium conductrix]
MVERVGASDEKASVPPPAPGGSGAATLPASRCDTQRELTGAEKSQIQKEVEREPQRVVLRVEVASKGQARVLTWSVIVLNAAFCFAALGLLLGQDKLATLGDWRRLQEAQLGLGCVCLGVLACVTLALTINVRAAARERRVWSDRQQYFFNTAIVLLCAVLMNVACFVSSLAATLAQPDCSYPWVALAALEFVRRFVFSFVLLFLLARLWNMQLWRGGAALDADPDRLLIADRPRADRLRSQKLMLACWLVLVAMIALNLAGRLQQYNHGARRLLKGCDTLLDDLQCTAPPLQVVSAAASFVTIALFTLAWGWVARRALRDHNNLPFSRYKATHIFVRVQVRVLGPVQVAMLLAALLMELVPSLRGNCTSAVSTQVGNLSLELSLTLAAVVLCVLYMPKSRELDSPILQELLQDFCWTQDEVPVALERRAQRLAASQLAPQGREQNVLESSVDYVPGKLRQGLGRLAGVQSLRAAAAQLAKEPLFCLETAIRLFYWSRLAYCNEPALDRKHVNAATALPLFGLQHWEKHCGHCVQGHGASAENAWTDLKSWRVAYSPEPRWSGRRISVHVGFLSAWLHDDFNDRVLAKVAELAARSATPLRIWVTGHSLGGALAVLASQQLSRAHPASKITCYTFGCPRVGNKAFASLFDETIPDAFAIVNATDPVTIIPKIGFKRVGRRVSIDAQGNLLLRPSYFERSVVHRGMRAADHLTGSYALSMATFLKAQFSPSKALPGGGKGVEALMAAVNIGALLVLSGADLASMRDQSMPLQLTEKLEAMQAAKARKLEGKGSKGAAPRRSRALGVCCGRGGVEACEGDEASPKGSPRASADEPRPSADEQV